MQCLSCILIYEYSDCCCSFFSPDECKDSLRSCGWACETGSSSHCFTGSLPCLTFLHLNIPLKFLGLISNAWTDQMHFLNAMQVGLAKSICSVVCEFITGVLHSAVMYVCTTHKEIFALYGVEAFKRSWFLNHFSVVKDSADDPWPLPRVFHTSACPDSDAASHVLAQIYCLFCCTERLVFRAAVSARCFHASVISKRFRRSQEHDWRTVRVFWHCQTETLH